MKKFGILFAGLFLFVNVASSQAVDDRAVIPVAVTLNSILRLNVTSGGNIEFNFNTLSDYENGIATGPAYETRFNVAASVDWRVSMSAEDLNLIGTDIVEGDGNTANILTLDNIGYSIGLEGTGDEDSFTILFDDEDDLVGPLTNSETFIVSPGELSNAGDITRNAFVIKWRCGTAEGTMNSASILTQGVAADRYATNVFLVLEPAP